MNRWFTRSFLRMGVACWAFASAAACTGSMGADGTENDREGPSGGRAAAQPGGEAQGAAGNGPSTTPGPGPDSPLDEAACASPTRRIWKLTPAQYERTVAAVVPALAQTGKALAPTLTHVVGFANDATVLQMSQPHVEALHANAGVIAPAIAKGWACAAADAGCARTALASVGKKLFRRPLSSEELDRYAGFYLEQARARGAAVGAEQVARALLLSPHFLYRTELGPEGATGATVALTSHERASALSYLISDGPPDAALMAAADGNGLGSAEAIAAHARRLLSSPATAQGLLAFFGELVPFAKVEATAKDPAVFPAWNDAVAGSAAAETARFVEHVLWSDDGTWKTLLGAGYGFVDGTLAPIYGLSLAKNAPMQKVAFPAGQRAGLLGQVSLLAVLAKDKETDPVVRGKYVRTRLLCGDIPPPPEDAACAVCHRLMDPIGLAFEPYDGVGHLRSEEAGKRIDASGRLEETSVSDRTFDGVAGLAALLAEAPEAIGCFAQQLHGYGLGRTLTDADRCAVRDLAVAMKGSGGNVRDLVVSLVSSDAFVNRLR